MSSILFYTAPLCNYWLVRDRWLQCCSYCQVFQGCSHKYANAPPESWGTRWVFLLCVEGLLSNDIKCGARRRNRTGTWRGTGQGYWCKQKDPSAYTQHLWIQAYVLTRNTHVRMKQSFSPHPLNYLHIIGSYGHAWISTEYASCDRITKHLTY